MKPQPIKIGLISLGCAKNLVDSEVMLGSLLREGMQLVADASQADVVVVNTCGFIEGAKKESIHAVLEANQWRVQGRCRAVIVAGCLPQRYPKQLQQELPEADAIIGLNEVPRIGEIVREVLAKVGQASRLSSEQKTDNRDGGPTLFWSGPARYVPDYAAPRFRLTPRHFAYVKIAEGCNHPCTFCSIPRIRGRHRSRPPADVVAEIRSLVGSGAREINLISQDTTFYGKDLGREEWKEGRADGETCSSNHPSIQPSLSALLRAVQQIDGDFWVRLLYTHPAHWSDELIETIAACDKVCRYVDMPLQHINDGMLRRMRRETSGQYIRDLIHRIRAGIPGIALRTTFIVGFPGETGDQFQELLAFLQETRFERVGVFTYSQEDHTPAAAMTSQVPARIRQQRRRRALTVQQQISCELNQNRIGQTIRVLVDKPKGKRWIARSPADAPEIDGTVLVRGRARPGEFATVRITGASEYDITAEVLG